MSFSQESFMKLFKSAIPLRATIAISLGLVGAACQSDINAAEAPTVIAAPTLDNPKAAGNVQTAVFSGGCFWGVQGVFEHVKGVREVLSGYAGGDKEHAQYETVSSGTTGHAESVQVSFDPAQVSYGQLLQVFFSVAHDPTQLNRQGPDYGTQYRSAIFYLDDGQKKIAQAYIMQLEGAHAYRRHIVTEIDAYKGFYPAEDYHQDFLIHNPYHPYIYYNDLPKIANLQKLFPAIYQEQAVTVKTTKGS
jgi:peptide-methionine (S)-S-oxide reductase